MLGDPSKARNKLKWTPSTNLEEMIKEMVEKDKEEAQKEAYLKSKGFEVISSLENPPNLSSK